MSKEIDDYFVARADGIRRRRPKLKLTTWWTDICAALERRQFHQWTDAHNILLSFSIDEQRLGLTLDHIKIREASELERAFSTIAGRHHQALIVLPTPVANANFGRIADLAVKTRLAGVAENRSFPDAGGLMGYGVNYADQLRRAATYVDKILKGANPGDLPVEQPTKGELVINMKTAKALGLTIPPSLLLRADQVIE